MTIYIIWFVAPGGGNPSSIRLFLKLAYRRSAMAIGSIEAWDHGRSWRVLSLRKLLEPNEPMSWDPVSPAVSLAIYSSDFFSLPPPRTPAPLAMEGAKLVEAERSARPSANIGHSSSISSRSLNQIEPLTSMGPDPRIPNGPVRTHSPRPGGGCSRNGVRRNAWASPARRAPPREPAKRRGSGAPRRAKRNRWC